MTAGPLASLVNTWDISFIYFRTGNLNYTRTKRNKVFKKTDAETLTSEEVTSYPPVSRSAHCLTCNKCRFVRLTHLNMTSF